MIKMIKISAVVLLGLGLTIANANQMQKYDVKSAKIEYELKGSGDVMGMIQIKSIGKKRLIFDDYGVRSLEEMSEVKKETTSGNTQVNKTHTMVYMNDAVIYKVDFEKKIINRMENQGVAMAAMFGGGKNIKESGEAMMKKMGGKKLGEAKVLGYTCIVWDLMGTKQCIYKGIPLKIESDIMGMKSTEIATKAEFDIAVSSDDFKLPDYSVYDFDIDRMMEGKEPKELDKSKLAQMDAKDNANAKVDSKKAAEGMAAMGAGIAALTEAGVDINKELTPDQEKIMHKAMMNAMGGEEKMLEMAKNDILQAASQEEMSFAKECFGSANTLKEANACVAKGNKMFDDEEEPLESWSSAEKDQMLKEMKQFEKMIPCIKAAQSMDAFQNCIPREMR